MPTRWEKNRQIVLPSQDIPDGLEGIQVKECDLDLIGVDRIRRETFFYDINSIFSPLLCCFSLSSSDGVSLCRCIRQAAFAPKGVAEEAE